MDSFLPTLVVASTFSARHLVETFGTFGVIAIVFAESWFAFFLPGDSLLAAAGFVASQGRMNLPLLCVGVTIAAVAGNQVGYAFGRKMGPSLFERDSRFFRRRNLEKAHAYFEKNGPKTIVIARFVPIVRTFACVVAGVARMDYKLFLTYNVIGAAGWGTGVTVAGWGLGKWLGKEFPIDKYILPFIAIVIAISFIPFVIEMRKAKKENAEGGAPKKSEALNGKN